jgi:hypothetical protein
MYTIFISKNFGKGRPIYENTHQKCPQNPKFAK